MIDNNTFFIQNLDIHMEEVFDILKNVIVYERYLPSFDDFKDLLYNAVIWNGQDFEGFKEIIEKLEIKMVYSISLTGSQLGITIPGHEDSVGIFAIYFEFNDLVHIYLRFSDWAFEFSEEIFGKDEIRDIFDEEDLMDMPDDDFI